MKVCKRTPEERCSSHGSSWPADSSACDTERVLDLVRAERNRQFEAYGTNADLEDGTGPETRWLAPVSYRYGAQDVERFFRQQYEDYEAETGKPTWLHLVREEIAEAFLEDDPIRLQEELVQVAALAVSWVEELRARQDFTSARR